MNICKSEQEYINQIIEPVKRVCRRYGYLPSVLIAQSCLENGYGIPSYWDNPQIAALMKYNNMVGIKSDLLNKSWVDCGLSVWPGKSLSKQTPEQSGKQMITIPDDFRIYDNIEQSFADYLCFMTWASNYGAGGRPKYGGEVLALKDPETLIRAVAVRGYASGQTYPTSVMRIVRKHNLTQYDNLTEVVPTEYYPAGVKMSNSPLINYTKLSPNNSGARNHTVDRITPHCVVGQLSIETMGSMFAQASYKASSNYGIGSDARVGMYVEEKNRSWCSSSSENDNRAITIECASNKTHPYAFKTEVYNKLIDLCVDICKRYKKTKLLWLGDKAKTLAYTPKPNEMILTVHRWFANKACPGDWMYSRMGDLAATVTAKLGTQVNNASTSTTGNVVYKVQVGAYTYKKNAEEMRKRVETEMRKRIKDEKERAEFRPFVTPKIDNYYRVQVGAYNNKQYAEIMRDKILDAKAGFSAIIKEYPA